MITNPTTFAVKKCPKTNKKSYVTEAEAEAWELRTRHQYGGRLQQYPYACDYCDSWHLTTTQPGNNTIAQMRYEGTGISAKKGLDTEEVVRLRNEGVSVQEIADRNKVSPSAVKYHLRKADGTLTKNDRTLPQLVTWENHRDRRTELEEELAQKRRQWEDQEANLTQDIEYIRTIEDRLFIERQLTITYGPNGAVVLTKYNRPMELTAEEVLRLVIELEDRLTTPAINTKEGAIVVKTTEVRAIHQAIKDRLSPSGLEGIEKALSHDQEGFILVDEANAKFMNMREDDIVCVISISDFRLVLDNLDDLNRAALDELARSGTPPVLFVKREKTKSAAA
jgi:predicted DNA-binding protein YlxM (UPF0122 family)